jgi:hypothetical protein
MADIDVVKKRTSVWPWIIGIILLVIVLWLIVSMMNTGGTTGTAPVSLLELRGTIAGLALA